MDPPSSSSAKQNSDEPEKEQTFQEKLEDWMKDYIVFWFPLVVKRDIKHPMVVAGFSITMLFLSLVFFGYTFYTGYQKEVKTKFLSLQSSAGECVAIPITHTETFLVDKDGDWENVPAFDIQEALFEVSFSSYAGAPSDWKKDMENVDDAIQTELAYLRSISNLPLKILHLTSWRSTIAASNSGTIRVWFNAQPEYMFDISGANIDVNMGKASESCGENDAWSFNDGVLTLEFTDVMDDNGDISYNNQNCRGFKLAQNGYDISYATENFNFNLDLRTALTIAALEANVISKRDLTTVADNFYTLENQARGDLEYTYDKEKNTLMFDEKYPEAAEIFVYESDDASAAPVFTTVLGKTQYTVDFTGYNWGVVGPGTDANNDDDEVSNWGDDSGSAFTGPYNCPGLCDAEDTANSCSMPDFVFYYEYADCVDQISICDSIPTGENCNMGFYQAECPVTCNSCEEQRFKVNLYSEDMYTINRNKMDPGHIGCATSTAGSGGVLGHLEPTDGAEVFASNMVDNPPFKLAEDFFTCNKEPLTAIQNQLGIARGNAALFFSLLVVIFVYVGGAVVPGLAKEHLATQDEIRSISVLMAEAAHMMRVNTPERLGEHHLSLLRDLNKAIAYAEERQPATQGEGGEATSAAADEEEKKKKKKEVKEGKPVTTTTTTEEFQLPPVKKPESKSDPSLNRGLSLDRYQVEEL